MRIEDVDTPRVVPGSAEGILETLRRRKWVIIQAFVFVTIIGLVTAALSPPVYATRAKLLVETPGGFNVVSQLDSNNSISPLMMPWLYAVSTNT